MGKALRTAPPPLAVVEGVHTRDIPPTGEAGFVIRPSAGGEAATLVSPDLAPCAACLAEMQNPKGRRYRYPFINCTDCGPRFSIIRRLPYDRPATTMAGFQMCPDCEAEYKDIRSRRYHAQPNCCPVCGPQAFYLDAAGARQPGDPIALAQKTLAAGGIVAVKGTGGIHLACRADSPEAVARLRQRKHRPEKPLALMARDRAAAARWCVITKEEAALLESPRRPILLLEKLDPAGESWLSATARLGVMLPYTPLHILLLDGTFGGPGLLVMTSANRPGCPVLIDNHQALEALAGVADGFLLHDRPIANRCDDSLALVWRGKTVFFRRSRGYAPQPIPLAREAGGVLAFGAEQKGSFAAGRGRHAFVNQYIGDLKNAETMDHYRAALAGTLGLFDLAPQVLVCDLHPDYASTREAEGWAARLGLPLRRVQHHWAHMAACMADNRLTAPPSAWSGTAPAWGRTAKPGGPSASSGTTHPAAGRGRSGRCCCRGAMSVLWRSAAQPWPWPPTPGALRRPPISPGGKGWRPCCRADTAASLPPGWGGCLTGSTPCSPAAPPPATTARPRLCWRPWPRAPRRRIYTGLSIMKKTGCAGLTPGR